MNFRNPILIIFLLTGSLTTIAQSAYITVEGEVTRPLKWTMTELNKIKPTEVKAKDRDGKEHTYKGVKLVQLLDSAGVTTGKQLRGENLAKYLLVKAADGYEVVISLPEIDPDFTEQTVLLAFEVDGTPLAKGDGPFRIVVPNDKRPARWVREVTSIKVVFSKE